MSGYNPAIKQNLTFFIILLAARLRTARPASRASPHRHQAQRFHSHSIIRYQI